MSEPAGGTTTTLHDVPERRDCTRCDGTQHLVWSNDGMGKYRCDTCELIVGFDVEGERAEFLLSRGLPSRYTKDIFGQSLLPTEHRLGSATS